MTVLALMVPAAVALAVAVAWPYAAFRRAGRLGRRADGSRSARRRAVERSRRWRAVVRGAVLPVAAAAVLGGAAYGLHEWVPWSAAAAVFGTATPETDLLARSLFDEVEQRGREQAEEAANALPSEFRVPGRIGVRDWFFQHFPLHPILATFLVVGAGWLCRRVVSERRRYLAGLGRRMRTYQRRDLDRMGVRAGRPRPPRRRRRARRP